MKNILKIIFLSLLLIAGIPAFANSLLAQTGGDLLADNTANTRASAPAFSTSSPFHSIITNGTLGSADISVGYLDGFSNSSTAIHLYLYNATSGGTQLDCSTPGGVLGDFNPFHNNITSASQFYHFIFTGSQCALSTSGSYSIRSSINGSSILFGADTADYSVTGTGWSRLCDLPGTTNISSNITTSTIWCPGVYVVSGNIEVANGATLTIEPGTRIKFDDTTPSSLTVNGVLNALGSAKFGEIFFTSNSSTPSLGDWGGITVGSGGEANFDYTIITDAGGTGTPEAGIYNNGGTVSITNSGIVYNENSGIKNSSGTTTIDKNTDIGFNDYGIYKDGGTISVSNSVIHDNSSYGIYNDTISSIDAEGNYWGDSSGPGDLGPGSGDNVSDYVDFDPWSSSGDLHYTNAPGSVDSGEIRWDGSTKYSTEFDNAVTTWNTLGSINIAPDTIFTVDDLTISDGDFGDIGWVGLWTPNVGADDIQLNEYYLDNYNSSTIQNVITHELGHALGLGHSFTGNIMYFMATSQTSLGSQDENDYYLLWP